MKNAVDLVEEVRQCDTLMQRATASYDVATLDGLLADDFVLISSGGGVFSKQEVLAETADRSTIWYCNDTCNVDIRVYNDDCAIVIADLHQHFQTSDKTVDVRLRYTDTWVNKGGRWLYASGHATRLS